MNSSNPFIRSAEDARSGAGAFARSDAGTFSIRGTMIKTLLSLVVMGVLVTLFINTGVAYAVASLSTPLYIVYSLVFIGVLTAIGFYAINNVRAAKYALFIYVAIESLFLAPFVAIANFYVPGAGITAAVVTIGFVGFMALFYSLFPKFIATLAPFITGAVIFVAVLSLINLIAAGFGAPLFLYNNVFFIGFLIILSSFTVATDFMSIDVMAREGLDKEYEWIGAYGLVTSVVWLYVNILRFIMLVFGNNRN